MPETTHAALFSKPHYFSITLEYKDWLRVIEALLADDQNELVGRIQKSWRPE